MMFDALRDALALLFPVECAGCGADDRALCDACRAELRPALALRPAAGLGVVTALDYSGAVRRIILSYKQHERTDVAWALAAPLGAAVDRALTQFGPAELALVPSNRRAYRSRGYDPVRMLVRRTGHRAVHVLRHRGATRSQKVLTVDERAANLTGAFVADRPLDGRRFVIVDDVLTSGATLGEAARAIREAGGEACGGATLAFTQRLLPIRDKPGGQDYGGVKGARV